MLERVGRMVVQFLGAAFRTVIREAVAAVRDGMVPVVVSGQGGVVPGQGWILQHRSETTAIVLGVGGKPAQLDERRVHVEQVDHRVALQPGLRHAWHAHDEGNPVGLLPEVGLTVLEFLAEVPAVVAPDHDDGIVGIFALGQGVEDDAEAVVGVTDVREVGALGLFVQVRLVGGQEARIGREQFLPCLVGDVL